MIYEDYEKENQEWDLFITRTLGPSAQLKHVSHYSNNRRIYYIGNKIVKVRKLVKEVYERAQDLAGEHAILLKLHNVDGICQNPTYLNKDGWEILSYDFTNGKTLENLMTENSTCIKNGILRNILKVIIAVNWHGIAHRDLKPANILVGENNKVYLLDFDQAIKTSRYRAILIDIFGIGNIKAPRGFFDFFWLLGQMRTNWFRYLRLITKPIRFFRLLIQNVFSRKKQPDLRQQSMKKVYNNESLEIKLLKQAWEIGMRSDANAPGNNIAYYSIDLAGCHFPGERPWVLRWHEVSKRVDFRGKRILELGCNLGLFSAFARRSGALKCVGVDHDKEILDGARLVSKAFHVNNDFYHVDFDMDASWEEKLPGFDLVIAMSVLNWLKNRERFLAFLGKHNELLYEGHDPLDVEFSRLQSVGFDRIEIVMITERNRTVLYASKSSMPNRIYS